MLMPCLLSVGQLFILHTIRCFGALLFAAVMTTRQFLSILVSSFLFGNPLSVGQWYETYCVMRKPAETCLHSGILPCDICITAEEHRALRTARASSCWESSPVHSMQHHMQAC